MKRQSVQRPPLLRRFEQKWQASRGHPPAVQVHECRSALGFTAPGFSSPRVPSHDACDNDLSDEWRIWRVDDPEWESDGVPEESVKKKRKKLPMPPAPPAPPILVVLTPSTGGQCLDAQAQEWRTILCELHSGLSLTDTEVSRSNRYLQKPTVSRKELFD